MELETVFYVVAIIFMAIMFILIASLVVAVFIIKSKINRLHTAFESKVDQAKSMATKASLGLKTLRYFIKK